MKKIALLIAFALLAGPVFAGQPIPSRDLAVSVTGNTYNAYSVVLTPDGTERYATVKLRPSTDGLWCRLSRSASPNTYTANAVYRTLKPDTELTLWPFGSSTVWYANTTDTAGSLVLEIQTYRISWP